MDETVRRHKYELGEDEMPTRWYNIVPDLPSPPQEAIIAGPFARRRFGTFVGARSGDKGGNANVGLWVRHPAEDAAVALAWQEADALTAPQVDATHDTAEVWAVDVDLDRLVARAADRSAPRRLRARGRAQPFAARNTRAAPGCCRWRRSPGAVRRRPAAARAAR